MTSKRPGTARRRPHHRRCPPVISTHAQPLINGVIPHRRITNRITRRNTHTKLNPIRNSRTPIRRKNDGLVMARRKVSQRIILTPARNHRTKSNLVLTGQRIDGLLRTEEQHDRRQNNHRGDNAQEHFNKVCRRSSEIIWINQAQQYRAIHYPQDTFATDQSMREQVHQHIAQPRRQRQPHHQSQQSRKERRRPRTSRELFACSNQQHQQYELNNKPDNV